MPKYNENSTITDRKQLIFKVFSILLHPYPATFLLDKNDSCFCDNLWQYYSRWLMYVLNNRNAVTAQ